MHGLFRKLGWLLKRRSREAELQEEIQFHLDEETEERLGAGLPQDQAERAARLDLGNVALVREDTRAAWGWTLWEQLLQDLRYAWRSMAANKTFTALAILSLALGIGANTAIFSLMDSILLRTLPVSDPRSLVLLEWHTERREMHGSNRHNDSYNDPNGGFVGGIFSYPAFDWFRKADSVFSSVFGYQGAGSLNLVVGDQAGLTNGEYVSGEYFQGLGVAPMAGRLLTPDDDQVGAAPVAVVSHGLSEKRFGDAAGAVGRSVRINNISFTIVGVTPPEFFGADPNAFPELYLPMHSNLVIDGGNPSRPIAPRYLDEEYDWVLIMARLRPGVTTAQAQALMADPFLNWERSVRTKRTNSDFPRLVVRDGAAGLDGLRRTYSRPLLILLILVALILTIACANISNLLLARAAARRREIAVRLSIGAGRFRVIRQLLTESILLASIGGALGIGIAFWGIRFLTALLSFGREGFTFRADLNWHVLGIVASLSLLAGVLFGLAPALQSTRVDLMHSLREVRTGLPRHSFRRVRLSRALMVSQIAITLLILVVAGLFLRTLNNLQSIQLGFNHDKLLTFSMDARQAGLANPEVISLYDDLQTRFADLPGVRSVSLSDVPLIGRGTSATQVDIAGIPQKVPQKGTSVLTIGPGFFKTMQIPMLLGREIDSRDERATPVAVVNQTFVKTKLNGANPIGVHLSLARACSKCNDVEIVGVSADAAYGDVRTAAPPVVYLPFAANVWGPVGEMTFEIRTAGNPLVLVEAVRDIVHRADHRLALAEITTQSTLIDRGIGQEITFARLCTAFALLALTIACVGLYASTSYNVARRTSEIGIRMALGARKSQVVGMVLREIALLVALGLAISIPAALFATKVVEASLFGMKRNDPLTMVLAAATIAAAAILAGYLPARNASHINPIQALRHE